MLYGMFTGSGHLLNWRLAMMVVLVFGICFSSLLGGGEFLALSCLPHDRLQGNTFSQIGKVLYDG